MSSLPMSEDVMTEHAMLVGRGVRPMALLTSMDGTDAATLKDLEARLLDIAATWHVVPFVVIDGRDCAHCGFAAEQWIWTCSCTL